MFLTAAETNVGIKKKTNQDSMLLKTADADGYPVCFAAVCDGMGGLAKGEVASGELTKHLSSWFEDELPFIINGVDEIHHMMDEASDSLIRLLKRCDVMISEYSERIGADCGTTACITLMYRDHYVVVNVGDSRLYKISEGEIDQITKDHTWIQEMIDSGKLTHEEAKYHKNRSVLTQCIGAMEGVSPDKTFGTYGNEDVFIVCCDGFRHAVSPDEFLRLFQTDRMNSEKSISDRCKLAIDINMQRKEKDNISVIVIKTTNQE